MKNAALILIVGATVALQWSLARATVGHQWAFDLVVVAVVYVALRWGATAGVIGGTLGGLLQDALAGTTIGVGGLAKTVIGFGAGVVGSQFILSRPFPRALLVAVATLLARGLMVALYALVDLHWPGVSWVAMLSETALNALAAFAVYQGVESVPGLLRRHPARRPFSARKW